MLVSRMSLEEKIGKLIQIRGEDFILGLQPEEVFLRAGAHC